MWEEGQAEATTSLHTEKNATRAFGFVLDRAAPVRFHGLKNCPLLYNSIRANRRTDGRTDGRVPCFRLLLYYRRIKRKIYLSLPVTEGRSRRIGYAVGSLRHRRSPRGSSLANLHLFIHTCYVFIHTFFIACAPLRLAPRANIRYPYKSVVSPGSLVYSS